MRELKFRAWAHASRCWIDGLYIGADGDIASYDASDWSLSQGLQNVTVEQCTGLKDKNGKEIYEGDIIKVDNDKLMIPHEHKTEASEVFYSNRETAFVYRTWYGEIPVSRHDTSVEVIGNIHENPELIKEEE